MKKKGGHSALQSRQNCEPCPRGTDCSAEGRPWVDTCLRLVSSHTLAHSVHVSREVFSKFKLFLHQHDISAEASRALNPHRLENRTFGCAVLFLCSPLRGTRLYMLVQPLVHSLLRLKLSSWLWTAELTFRVFDIIRTPSFFVFLIEQFFWRPNEGEHKYTNIN